MGAFKTEFKYRDDILGLNLKRSISGETPYDLFWSIFNDGELKEAREGLKRITVLHERGAKFVAHVDFDGQDEHGFSAPVVFNEDDLDRWVQSLGVAFEMGQ